MLGSNETSPNVTDSIADNQTVIFLSYIGGNENDTIIKVKTGPDDSIYIIGTTESYNFPFFKDKVKQIGDVRTSLGRFTYTDCFLAKITQYGELVFFIVFGGKYDDEPHDLTITSNGDIIVVGATISVNFPTTSDASQKFRSGWTWDGFVSRFSSTGELLYSTYIGGYNNDMITGIELWQDEIIITGWTNSPDFPMVFSPINSFNAEMDVFLARLTADCRNITFSMFLGSDGLEYPSLSGDCLEVDNLGNVMIIGTLTNKSTMFNNPPIQQNGSFVVILNKEGNIVQSIIIDDEGNEFGECIRLGDDGILAAVVIQELSFSFMSEMVRYNSLIIKLDPYSGRIIQNKTIMTDKSIITTDIATDVNGNLIVATWTDSDLYVMNPLQNQMGGIDIYVMILNDTFDRVFGTYFGGNDAESTPRLVIDSKNRIILAGTTNSIDIATKNGFQCFKADGDYDTDGVIVIMDLSLLGKEPFEIDARNLLLVGLSISLMIGIILIVYPIISKKRAIKNN